MPDQHQCKHTTQKTFLIPPPNSDEIRFLYRDQRDRKLHPFDALTSHDIFPLLPHNTTCCPFHKHSLRPKLHLHHKNNRCLIFYQPDHSKIGRASCRERGSNSDGRHTILQGDWSSDVCSSDLRSVFYIEISAIENCIHLML